MLLRTVRNAIITMEPGEQREFPFADVERRTICYYVSHLGKLLGREYHMRTANTRKTYIVFREA